MTNFCLVFMTKDTLNPLPNSFNFFVKQRLDKIEHPALITEWTHNMVTSDYLLQ